MTMMTEKTKKLAEEDRGGENKGEKKVSGEMEILQEPVAKEEGDC